MKLSLLFISNTSIYIVFIHWVNVSPIPKARIVLYKKLWLTLSKAFSWSRKLKAAGVSSLLAISIKSLKVPSIINSDEQMTCYQRSGTPFKTQKYLSCYTLFYKKPLIRNLCPSKQKLVKRAHSNS